MSGEGPAAGGGYPIPPKERAVEGILGLAFAGLFKAGDKLPGERALCERLGVSRTALRSAIKQLVAQGMLESRHGSGTYLRRPKPTQVFQESGSFTDIVEATGRSAGSRTLHSRTARADDLLAEKMGGRSRFPRLHRRARPVGRRHAHRHSDVLYRHAALSGNR